MFSKSLKRLFPSESPIAFGSAETADQRGRVSITDLDSVATKETFNEADYLATNADVARDVERGIWKTGRDHFDRYGHSEARSLRRSSLIHAARAQKLEKILPLLNMEMPHVRRGDKFDFLSDELRAETGISDTDNVASNNYDGYIETLIESVPDGLILDCGAGKRKKYYSNVLNYEIVDYDTTDVVGVGEALPFKDGSFDGVISVAVLEHVRDPFRCASEIIRVLKPGSKLICCVPFLQPLHGYPHHYYNMSPQGIRALFDRSLVIDDHKVIESLLPIWSLQWIVNSWAAGLSGATREAFLNTPLKDLMRQPNDMLHEPWVKELPEEKNFELASATMIFAHKP